MSDKFYRMCRSFFAGIALLLLPVAMSAAGPKEPLRSVRPTMGPGEVLVAFKPTHSISTLSIHSMSLIATSYTLGVSKKGVRFSRIVLHRSASVDDAIAMYQADPAVLAVSPNYLNYPTLTPNDPS